VYISLTKPGISKKKSKNIRVTYDHRVLSWQRLLLAYNWERERWENLANTPPPHYRYELGADLAGFLDSAQAERSSNTPPPPNCEIDPLFSRSRRNFYKLFISLLCVTYISKIIPQRYFCLNLCQF
jgi:hypothetical protein